MNCACCVLRVACCMLRVACNVCCMLHAARKFADQPFSDWLFAAGCNLLATGIHLPSSYVPVVACEGAVVVLVDLLVVRLDVCTYAYIHTCILYVNGSGACLPTLQLNQSF